MPQPAKRHRFGICLAMVLAVGLSCRSPAFAQQQEEPEPHPSPTQGESYALPIVSMTAMPSYGAAPLFVGFFPDVIDPRNAGAVSFRWNFGDGNVSTLPPLYVYNTYSRPGSYLVTLTVTTADGRSATAFASVTVVAPSELQSAPSR